MKTILFLLLLLAFVPVAAQRPQAPQRQVLYDFRNERPNKPAKISAATQRDVLSKVFRRYLTNVNRCQANFDAGENFLAGSRRAGQIVPDVAEAVDGSFTAAGQNETAYVIFVNECNASHADNFGSKRVAIFSGPRLVADIDVDFKNSIVAKTDLDLDGINELLMTSGDMAQGEIIEMAALMSFQNGRMRVIQDFGTVITDDCASLRPTAATKAAVLSYANATLGQIPKIRVDYYAAGCNRARRWRAIKGPI
ncbi:MAG TPA: hypothetical protein VFY61_04585 [Pyrinomonadaceae bacterium]|nr:hypothetical protein [Pyrinomonadaceae bacterium]